MGTIRVINEQVGLEQVTHSSSPDMSGSCSPGRSMSRSVVDTGRDRLCGVPGCDAWMTSLLRSVISLRAQCGQSCKVTCCSCVLDSETAASANTLRKGNYAWMKQAASCESVMWVRF